MPSIDNVRDFWNSNPLLTGELEFSPGSREWFEAFDEIKDSIMRADRLPLWIGPRLIEGKKMLDVGCGPGYWCRAVRGLNTRYYGIDISETSLDMAKRSAELFGCDCTLQVGNAEQLDFPDESFDHVISEGVIHHTPDTEKALHEIVRVLKKGRTATVSVYYKNILLRNKWLFSTCLAVMGGLKLAIKGRGRDKMRQANSVDDFIRMYDGDKNPIGKGYTMAELVSMLPGSATIKSKYLYFSPLRAFSRGTLQTLNALLDDYFGLMICLVIEKTR